MKDELIFRQRGVSEKEASASGQEDNQLIAACSNSSDPVVKLPYGWWSSQATLDMFHQGVYKHRRSPAGNKHAEPMTARFSMISSGPSGIEPSAAERRNSSLPESDFWHHSRGDYDIRQYNIKLLHRRVARERMEKYTLYIALFTAAVTAFLLSFLSAMIAL